VNSEELIDMLDESSLDPEEWSPIKINRRRFLKEVIRSPHSSLAPFVDSNPV